ncbi:uncharacterized protein RAG0_07399 [Rhynchosporium agropyri]|uniref:Transmembrane protein n=1 Tax=Rhynchosporium agropyri TaxID=914238 RepID=A0A1E1KLC4_9HELO|nr:uncharacterized protein RAG0_07399 [Rhynchosporium agropyri]
MSLQRDEPRDGAASSPFMHSSGSAFLFPAEAIGDLVSRANDLIAGHREWLSKLPVQKQEVKRQVEAVPQAIPPPSPISSPNEQNPALLPPIDPAGIGNLLPSIFVSVRLGPAPKPTSSTITSSSTSKSRARATTTRRTSRSTTEATTTPLTTTSTSSADSRTSQVTSTSTADSTTTRQTSTSTAGAITTPPPRGPPSQGPDGAAASISSLQSALNSANDALASARQSASLALANASASLQAALNSASIQSQSALAAASSASLAIASAQASANATVASATNALASAQSSASAALRNATSMAGGAQASATSAAGQAQATLSAVASQASSAIAASRISAMRTITFVLALTFSILGSSIITALLIFLILSCIRKRRAKRQDELKSSIHRKRHESDESEPPSLSEFPLPSNRTRWSRGVSERGSWRNRGVGDAGYWPAGNERVSASDREREAWMRSRESLRERDVRLPPQASRTTWANGPALAGREGPRGMDGPRASEPYMQKNTSVGSLLRQTWSVNDEPPRSQDATLVSTPGFAPGRNDLSRDGLMHQRSNAAGTPGFAQNRSNLTHDANSFPVATTPVFAPGMTILPPLRVQNPSQNDQLSSRDNTPLPVFAPRKSSPTLPPGESRDGSIMVRKNTLTYDSEHPDEPPKFTTWLEQSYRSVSPFTPRTPAPEMKSVQPEVSVAPVKRQSVSLFSPKTTAPQLKIVQPEASTEPVKRQSLSLFPPLSAVKTSAPGMPEVSGAQLGRQSGRFDNERRTPFEQSRDSDGSAIIGAAM